MISSQRERWHAHLREPCTSVWEAWFYLESVGVLSTPTLWTETSVPYKRNEASTVEEQTNSRRVVIWRHWWSSSMVMGNGKLDQIAGPSLLSTGDSSGHQWPSYHLPTYIREDITTMNQLKVGGKRPWCPMGIKRSSYGVYMRHLACTQTSLVEILRRKRARVAVAWVRPKPNWCCDLTGDSIFMPPWHLPTLYSAGRMDGLGITVFIPFIPWKELKWERKEHLFFLLL